MLTALKAANLTVRFLLELSALGALAYWGAHAGRGLGTKVLLGVGAPLLAAVVWGLMVAPGASIAVPGPVRFLLELLIFGLAVAALVATGRVKLGVALGMVYVINRILMTIWGQ